MRLPDYLWIKGQKHYLYQVYDDNDYEDLRRYCERQKRRNGTSWYIRSFDVMSIFPETKHALYLNKTINPMHKQQKYRKSPNDKKWQNTRWG